MKLCIPETQHQEHREEAVQGFFLAWTKSIPVEVAEIVRKTDDLSDFLLSSETLGTYVPLKVARLFVVYFGHNRGARTTVRTLSLRLVFSG
jgi:hypothetical protein